jgi:hypothetical protein
LQISLLLSELIVATVAAGPGVEPESPQARIMAVILDQIPTQPITSLKSPLPSYLRLGRIRAAEKKNYPKREIKKLINFSP